MNNILKKAITYSLLATTGFGLISFSDQNVQAKSVPATQKSIRGTWYNYNKYNNSTNNGGLGKKFAKLTINSKSFTWNGHHFDNSAGTRKKLYYLFDSKNPVKTGFSDGLAAWTKKMKINGKYQTVLVTYQRMLFFQVFTKKPVKHDYSYTLKGKKADNYQYYIGR
ncbi:hypothetical protein [Lactobacillus sp. Sy-1]|uniref:hypothetical protein n=1 Tax=Lactobacillus sp. Sy-1 TaxID=2109645 RepID=UPI001C5AFCC4|nr:hypothetical protein [Lactobacillus sp. Sy-1]MBW1606080.1 hypothetical protein [Lactobacillus sp. Sy-1]